MAVLGVQQLLAALGFTLGVFLYWQVARRWDQQKFRLSLLPWLILGGLIGFARLHGMVVGVWPSHPAWSYLLLLLVFTVLAMWKLGHARDAGWVLALVFGLASVQVFQFTRVAWVFLSVMPITLSYLALSQFKWMKDVVAWLPHICEAWIGSFGALAGGAGALSAIGFGLAKTAIMPLVFYLIKDEKKESGTYMRTAIMALGISQAVSELVRLLSL
ncbi:MAG TPA: hypothetical protein ENN60_01385 [archaeon]|nr:hypothetical protein [archaeon]